MAATYKERFFRDGLLTSTGLAIPRYARGNGCGDVGQAGRLRPGDVEDVPLAGMTRYWLRDQPLPPGTIHLTVGFEGSRRSDRVSVSTDVTLTGDPVAYPSPGQLVDAALSTPGFVETLERLPDPHDWANTHVSAWKKPPYPTQPRLEGARKAPDGILEVTQFFARSDITIPFVVSAVIDPWTAESYGASAWPGWVFPGSGSAEAEPSDRATEEPSFQPWTPEGITATSDLKAIANASGWTLDQAKAQPATATSRPASTSPAAASSRPRSCRSPDSRPTPRRSSPSSPRTCERMCSWT
ncbi:hypothetical protein BH23CHL8_BH23CHL8_12490 [soil metagenome]